MHNSFLHIFHYSFQKSCATKIFNYTEKNFCRKTFLLTPLRSFLTLFSAELIRNKNHVPSLTSGLVFMILFSPHFIFIFFISFLLFQIIFPTACPLKPHSLCLRPVFLQSVHLCSATCTHPISVLTNVPLTLSRITTHAPFTNRQRIDWFIEGQPFLWWYDSAPRPPSPSPVSKLSLLHSLPVCRRSSLLAGEGGGRGAES